jgi:hypothetical protein
VTDPLPPPAPSPDAKPHEPDGVAPPRIENALPVPVSPVPAHLTPGAFPAYPGGVGSPLPSNPYAVAPALPSPPNGYASPPNGYAHPQSPMAHASNTGNFLAVGHYSGQPTPSQPIPTGSFPAPPGASTTGGFPAAGLQPQGPMSAPGSTPQAQPTQAAQPPQSPGIMPPGATRVTVLLPEPGTTLVSSRGSYTVTAVLGAGEFGAVYDSLGPFDQTYAVKVIRPANRPYAEVQAEWAREVSRLLSLRHPNVVYIHDAFEQNALFFLALEKCEHPLKAMLGAPMQEGLVLELTRQLLAAVQYLHDNDVVHDDLHAGNVLVTHATDRPVVKISDFGISHELRGLPAIRPNVVHHAIMAPEILATGFTSKQSDLYQVGLLLYWMVTGESAVPANLPYAELVRFVAEGEPRRRAEAIGTPLGLLVAKLLRRREAYRYSSAREVWAEMRQLSTWKDRQLFPVR